MAEELCQRPKLFWLVARRLSDSIELWGAGGGSRDKGRGVFRDKHMEIRESFKKLRTRHSVLIHVLVQSTLHKYAYQPVSVAHNST